MADITLQHLHNGIQGEGKELNPPSPQKQDISGILQTNEVAEEFTERNPRMLVKC